MKDRTKSHKRSSSPAFVAGIVIIAFLYSIAIFADFLAPYDYREQTRNEPSAPPTNIEWFSTDSSGGSSFAPAIRPRRLTDARNLIYEEDQTARFEVGLFVTGYSYHLFGLIPTRVHLFGVNSTDQEVPRIRLLGTDQLGRDRFSRLVHAVKFSLVVSPIGTLLACLIGIIFGAVSGYAHRRLDAVMMAIADTMISLPTLILILAARAAFPLELPPFTAAVLLISIFALTGWAEMARLTRGLVSSTKQREYVLAARSIGLTEIGILSRHILPNITSPLLVQATLMLPIFLLAEIALSFLGVGLQEPEPSLGNLLSAAGDLTQLGNAPFLLLSPAIPIFLFVLGIRLIARRFDAASTPSMR